VWSAVLIACHVGYRGLLEQIRDTRRHASTPSRLRPSWLSAAVHLFEEPRTSFKNALPTAVLSNESPRLRGAH